MLVRIVGHCWSVKVTIVLLLECGGCIQTIVHFSDIYERSAEFMKDTTPTRIRIRRFITDRYAYRTQPNFLSELVAFGIIVATAAWPIFMLTSAVVGTLK